MKPAGDVLRAAEWQVDSIPFRMAADLVVAYHYARGSANTATFRHGLFRAQNPIECLGAAMWMPPTRVAAESVAGDAWREVLTLSRLVIAPEVPTNGASFLLSKSTKLIRADGRFRSLVTYADEGQGHTGAIYRAAGWTYVGTSLGDPVYRDEHGRQVARKSAARSRTHAEMTAAGYAHGGRTRKHKFVLELR